MRNYFIFLPESGGMVDSRELSIHIEHLPPIQRARERVEYITVPGRSGFLTKTEGKEGKKIYDPYVKPLEICALDKGKIDSIKNIMKGNGKIILSNEPQYRYTVSITERFEFNRIFRGWHQATIPMQTQPFKESVEEKIYSCLIKTSGIGRAEYFISLNVNTDEPCPFFMECDLHDDREGDLLSPGYGIMFNGKRTLSGHMKGYKLYMDNEKGLLYNENGETLLPDVKTGDFPMYLKNGRNSFMLMHYSGNSLKDRMIIKYRGWFL